MKKNTTLHTNTSDKHTLLQHLGWSVHFENQLTAMNEPHSRIARVISVQRNQFLVTNGQKEWLCIPAGKLKHFKNGDYPVTGDWVVVNDSIITNVISRKNILSRGEAGSRGSRSKSAARKQAIAANLDAVFIVCGLDRDFNVRRLERYLALVYNCGLSPVIVLTKADLHEVTDSFHTEVQDIAIDVPIVLTSMVGDKGKEELGNYLGCGQTVAMMGSSGAGKSTLANMLYGKDIQTTGTVSDSVGKGRHTTTVRELIRMPQGGMLMDNPGIREIAFHENGDGIKSTFADIQEFAKMCRFADCSHEHEPGCAVLHAVKTGKLTHERFESYHKMNKEMQFLSNRRIKSMDRIEKENWQDVSLLRKQINKRNKG